MGAAMTDLDRLYFRQLLAGRDIASSDPIARQMVNFVYLIGDRQTGEAVVVDPAYGIKDILTVLDEDGMTLVGALATHYHPDHVGGDMMGTQIAGVRELLALRPVPVHVQSDEADGINELTVGPNGVEIYEGANLTNAIGEDSYNTLATSIRGDYLHLVCNVAATSWRCVAKRGIWLPA